jgi:hypothetical protein
MTTFTITVETDHPDGARIAYDAGEQIACALGYAGSHTFVVLLNDGRIDMEAWQYDGEETA